MTKSEAAKNYYEQGFQLLPLRKNSKRPLALGWKELQYRRPPLERVLQYFSKDQEENIGIITGAISNLTVLDFDNKSEGTLAFLRQLHTLTAETPHGFHAYFSYVKVGNAVKVNFRSLQFDVRSDGGYVVAPPSVIDGNPYLWRDDLGVRVKILPPEIISILNFRTSPRNPDRWREILQETTPGSRNLNAASLIGKLLIYLPPKEWTLIAWPLVQAWNKSLVSEGLPEYELRRTFESIAKKELANLSRLDKK